MAKITPDMGLVIPDQTDPAFTWADLINEAFYRIDNHDHDFSSQNGLYIDIGSIKITDNFSVENNGYFSNANNVSFVVNNGNILLNSFYTDDVDLYFLDGYNNFIRLTKAGSINVLLTQGGIHLDYPTTSASVTYDASLQKYTWKDSNNNLAYLIADTLNCNNISTFLDIESISCTLYSYSIVSDTPATASTLVITDSSNNYNYLASGYSLSSIVKRDSAGSISPQQLTSFTISDSISYDTGDFNPLSPQEVTQPNKMFSWFLTYQVNSLTRIPILTSNYTIYTPNGISLTGAYFASDGTSFFSSGVFSGNLGSFFKNNYQNGDDYILSWGGSPLSFNYQIKSSNATGNVFPVAISIGGTIS